ncbi:hypothetical protein E4V28_05460, partial [Proteus mirabilis]
LIKTFVQDLFPFIGKRSISEIKPFELLEVLRLYSFDLYVCKCHVYKSKMCIKNLYTSLYIFFMDSGRTCRTVTDE